MPCAGNACAQLQGTALKAPPGFPPHRHSPLQISHCGYAHGLGVGLATVPNARTDMQSSVYIPLNFCLPVSSTGSTRVVPIIFLFFSLSMTLCDVSPYYRVLLLCCMCSNYLWGRSISWAGACMQ